LSRLLIVYPYGLFLFFCFIILTVPDFDFLLFSLSSNNPRLNRTPRRFHSLCASYHGTTFISGYVPSTMLKANSMSAFLDFCYLARRHSHVTTDIEAMKPWRRHWWHFTNIARFSLTVESVTVSLFRVNMPSHITLRMSTVLDHLMVFARSSTMSCGNRLFFQAAHRISVWSLSLFPFYRFNHR
jgi:hypothetical protein